MKEVTLKHILLTVIDYRGKTPKKLGGDWSAEGYRAISAMNIKDGMLVKEESIKFLDEELYKKWMKQEVQKHDILLTSEAPLGEVLFWDSTEKIVLSQRVFCLRPNPNEVYPKYLYAVMRTNKFYKKLIQRQSGTTVFGIRQSQLLKIKINLPDYKEQVRIGDIYYAYEKKHKINNEIISYLEEYCQLLYHKWFVDFNFPNKEGKPYKDSGGEMVEVGGKIIPKGWEIKQLNFIVNKSTNSLSPKDSADEFYKYYSIPVYDETHLYSFESGDKIRSSKYKVNNKNLLVSKLNPWFKRVVYPYNVDKAICSTEYVVWKPKVDNILEYLYVLAKTNNFTKHNTRAATGTSNSHKRVNPDYMLRYNIKYNSDIIKAFNNTVKPFVQKIFSLYEENHLLEETRDLLIKKLIK